ncbi:MULTISPECIES: hypothetical protein [Pectobacterium]|uniref:hypothetical protein n=1 Tax=Pectobacterium TaxID=122277 RepID=UPI000CE68874|nr:MULTISPECIES: hypothetical protein [Pectobacterium]MBN3181740.1 hypothetical protein [Pectobacterium brasiliense]PPE59514.1 hypothetical protein F152LOC_03201 [Pectobacterium brasiliense]
MIKNLVDIVNLILNLQKSFKKTNEEKFNASIIELYNALKKCNSAFAALDNDHTSNEKKFAHKESLKNLVGAFSKFYDYFKINDNIEMISDIGSYIGLESLSASSYYENPAKLDPHVIEDIIKNTGNGSFEKAIETLRIFLKENIKNNHDLFSILND